jgi:HEAT repeat protein
MLWWTLRQLKSNDRAKRLSAVQKLSDDREGRATQAVIEVLQSDFDRYVRLAAIGVLGKLKDQAAVAPLVELLSDKSGAFRFAAANALNEIGWQPKEDEQRGWYVVARRDWEQAARLGAAAVNPLLAALKEDDISLRRAAIQTLGKIGDTRAIAPLIELRKDKAVSKDVVAALARLYPFTPHSTRRQSGARI